MFLWGSIPIQTACAGGFGGRAGSDMNTSHIFSQGALAVITLGGGRTGDGAARARGSVSQGFPSAQWPASPYWGWGWVPSCWSTDPKVQGWTGSIPLKCVLSPLPGEIPALEGRSGGQERLVGAFHWGWWQAANGTSDVLFVWVLGMSDLCWVATLDLNSFCVSQLRSLSAEISIKPPLQCGASLWSNSHMPAFISSRVQASHNPLISPTGPLPSPRACLPGVGPQPGAPGVWLKLLTFCGGWSLTQAPFSNVPSLGHRSWPDLFSSLFIWFYVYGFLWPWLYRILLLVFSYFSVRIIPYIDIFWCVLGEVTSTSSYSFILISPF